MMKEQLNVQPNVPASTQAKLQLSSQISAWLDGELSEAEAQRVLNAVARQPALQAQCGTLWLIGDAMREEAALSAGFSERVMAALDTEPTVLAPIVLRPVRGLSAAQRWMPLAAAVSGVAIVAWVALTGSIAQQTAVPAMAAVKPATQMVGLQGIPRNRATAADEDRLYVMAHQAYGPGVQMAGVSGYVRPVSMDEPLASR